MVSSQCEAKPMLCQALSQLSQNSLGGLPDWAQLAVCEEVKRCKIEIATGLDIPSRSFKSRWSAVLQILQDYHPIWIPVFVLQWAHDVNKLQQWLPQCAIRRWPWNTRLVMQQDCSCSGCKVPVSARVRIPRCAQTLLPQSWKPATIVTVESKHRR